jgi:hypothetical protein
MPDIPAVDVPAEGLERMRGKMDVVLINPQYTTAMLLGDKVEDSERMVSLIAPPKTRTSICFGAGS